MRTQLLLLSILFVSLPFLAFTQDNEPEPPQLIYSLDSIQKGIDCYDRGSYDSAITLFNHVPLNDTNYALAQYELSLALYAKEDYKASLDAALTALNYSDSTDPGYFTSAGNAYDELGEPEKALAIYEEGLKRFPYSYLILFNRSIVYTSQEKYDKALADLKRAVEINPFHASSHLQLANYALNEEQYAQALLSIGYFLMLEPSSGRSNAVLTYMNSAVSDKKELETKNIDISESPDDFKKINLLIKSYAALRDDYEVESDLNVALVKQMDLSIRQTMTLKKSNDFWVNYYAPFYRRVIDEESFEYFSYLISASSASEVHQKIIEKNLQDIIEFIKWEYVTLKDVHGLHHQDYNNENPEIRYWFYEDANRLEAVGNVTKNGEKTGDYTFLYNEGSVSARGAMKDDQRTGEWTFYYPNGEVLFKGNFEEGTLNGPAVGYYANGRKEKELSYKEGYYNGVSRIFNKSGYLERIMFHQEGNIEDSLIYFYSNANRSSYLPMKESKVDGQAIYYYSNGDISGTVSFVEDVNNGESFSYYRDSVLSVKSNYKDGSLHGPYESYYPNGKLESKGSYDMGIRIGKWETYYYDGTRASTAEYDESGKQNGHQEYFDENGVLSVSYEYLRGEIKEYKHFDQDGNEIHSDVRKKGKFWYEDYTIHGVKTSEGFYYGDHKEGEWRYFNDNGDVDAVEQFNENGQLSGECTYYFDHGQVSGIVNYHNDTLHGLSRSYHKNGQLSEHGNYLDGNMHGRWITYYPDGTMRYDYFYQAGKQHGAQIDYDPDGIVSTISYFNRGELYKTTDISPDSSFVNTQKLNTVADTFLSIYPNKQVCIQIPYLGGQINGLANWYYANGQLEMQGAFITNERHGTWKLYYPDGSLREERHYHLGIPVDTWRDYNRNGQVTSEINYENGSRHGEEIYYHPNGNIDTRSTYDQGKYDGKRYMYDSGGNLGHIRIYDHDRIIGYSYLDESGEEKPMIPIDNETAEVKSYFQNGQLSRTYTLKKGLLEGEYLCYNQDGTMRERMSFTNGSYDGPIEEYYDDGQLRERLVYKNGSLDGESTRYHANGNLSMKFNFKNDMRHGITEIYNEEGGLLARYMFREGDLYEVLEENYEAGN